MRTFVKELALVALFLCITAPLTKAQSTSTTGAEPTTGMTTGPQSTPGMTTGPQSTTGMTPDPQSTPECEEEDDEDEGVEGEGNIEMKAEIKWAQRMKGIGRVIKKIRDIMEKLREMMKGGREEGAKDD